MMNGPCYPARAYADVLTKVYYESLVVSTREGIYRPLVYPEPE